MANRRIVLISNAPGVPTSAKRPIELDTVLTAPDNRVLLLPETDPAGDPFTFSAIVPSDLYVYSGNMIKFAGSAGKIIYVNWGDGDENTYTFTSSPVSLVHEYATAGTYTVTISGDTNFITEMQFDSSPVSFPINSVTTALTSFIFRGFSTTQYLTGSPASFPLTLTHLELYKCDITGLAADMSDFPSSLTYLRFDPVIGSTFIGSIGDLQSTALTHLILNNLNGIIGVLTDLNVQTGLQVFSYRSNSGTGLTGSISTITAPLTHLEIAGEANITGSINGLPSTLEHLLLSNCGTSITGSIMGTLPANLYNLWLLNLGNNITGTLNANLQASITSLYLMNGTGYGGGDLAYLNNVKYVNLQNLSCTFTYSSNTWTTMNGFYVTPAATFGMSSADVEDLIIDLANATWNTAGVLDLTGSNGIPNISDPDVAAALAELSTKSVDVYYNT